MTLLKKAEICAYKIHAGQFRIANPEKYTLYVNHVIEVKNLVEKFGGTEEDQIVALLHDSIEDSSEKGYDYDYIENEFGRKIANRVLELTNQKVNPWTGKKLSEKEWKLAKKDIQVFHVSKMNTGNQLVKCCDQIQNMSDYRDFPFERHDKQQNYNEKAIAVVRACDKIPVGAMVFAEKMYLYAKKFFEDNKGKQIYHQNYIPNFCGAQKLICR